jgi:hypothetical protein
MSESLPTYRFNGYTLRPATPEDLPLATAWCVADPDHTWEAQHKFYWIEQKQGGNSYVVEDELGVVFFIKYIRDGVKLELNIQFDRGLHMRLRSAAGMKATQAWMDKNLAEVGFKALYFQSASENLTRFCVTQLGYRKNGAIWEKTLQPARDEGVVNA